MAKTIDEYIAFIEEIKNICRKHNIYMVGTYNNEGIYGEITLFDPTDKERDRDVKRAFNFDYDNPMW
jgi:hypothetical protein